MFDISTRDILYENAYYEVYLIREILQVRELALGTVMNQRYIIKDEEPVNVLVGMVDSMSASYTAEFTKKLMPLMMTSAFKILDQIWEWILSENSKVPRGVFWSFREKFRVFSNQSLTYPDFLDSNSNFQCILKKLYAHFWPRRNAIIHSGWGELTANGIHFDFQYTDVAQVPNRNVHVKEFLHFKDILTFADFSRQLLETLVAPERQTKERLSVLKILSDQLSKFHNCPVFGEKQILIFHVHRITRNSEISIKDIRDILERSSFGHPYYFILTITDENNNETWEVFSEDLPKGDILSLENLRSLKKES